MPFVEVAEAHAQFESGRDRSGLLEVQLKHCTVNEHFCVWLSWLTDPVLRSRQEFRSLDFCTCCLLNF